jgi:hypothetical protein
MKALQELFLSNRLGSAMTRTVVCVLMVLSCTVVRAQQPDSSATRLRFKDIVQARGYVKNLNIVSISPNKLIGNSTENFLHARLNLKIEPGKGFRLAAEMRTRLFYAGRTATTTTVQANFEKDQGLVDMAWNIGRSDAVLLTTTIDRLYAQWGNSKMEVRLGRQRINWGVNLAWNPNDIFNAYNFIDFDYEERPGTDAFRFQYFGKKMSGFEVAYAPRADWRQHTAAFMYRINARGYDIQFIGGQYKTDVTAGIGWAGNLGNAGFKGEAQWFGPYDAFADSAHAVVGALSVDYAFKNSLYLNGSIMVNSRGMTGSDPLRLASFFGGAALSAKNLMPTRYNAFVTASYPITPLFSAALAVIYGQGPNLLLLNPSLSYSVSNSFDILLAAQMFFSDFPEVQNNNLVSRYQNVSNSVFLRVKFSY